MGESFAPDTQGVEGIGTVGTILQLVFFRLGQLFASLVFASIVDTGCLYGYQQVLIVLDVEHGHQLGFTGKHSVDEQPLLDML